jgi:hypothetical protein
MAKRIVDFVGLNRNIVKKSSTTTNSITSGERIERSEILAISGLEVAQKELFPAKTAIERDTKFLVERAGLFSFEDHFSVSDRSGLKNYSISIDFKITSSLISAIPAANWVDSTVAPNNAVFFSIIASRKPTGSPGFNDGINDFAIGFLVDSNQSSGQKRRLAIYYKEKFYLFDIPSQSAGDPLFSFVNESSTANVNLTLVFSDLEDRSEFKSSNADKYTGNQQVAGVYLNGVRLGYVSSNGLHFFIGFNSAINKTFINSRNGTSQDLRDAKFHDGEVNSFFRAYKRETSPVGATRFPNSIDGSIFLNYIIAWDKYLSPKEVGDLQGIPKDQFFLNSLGVNSKLIDAFPTSVFQYFGSSLVVGNIDGSNFITDEFTTGMTNSYLTTAELDEDVDFFSALMNNLHGPYGFSTFKQLRSSHNWLIRSYNKNNTFSFISENGQERVVTKDGKVLSNHKDKYGAITNVTETPATDQHNPIEMIATVSDGFDDEKLMIKASYSNENQFFKNKVVNVETSRELEDSETYDDLIAIMDNETTPLKSFDKLTYKQSIFPKNLYTHSKNHRVRPSYSSDIWRDVRASRTETEVNNGFGYYTPSQSFWPLDAEENFTTLPASNYYGGALGYNSFGAAGILQNSYSLFATSSTLSGVEVDGVVSASILYSRPHTLTSSTSVKNPFLTNLSGGTIGDCSKFTGHAKWEAGDMAGFFNTDGNFQLSPKQPFPDSYDEWAESFRGLGKGYSVVPEFRISDHINHYLTNGFTSQKLDIFDIKGGNQDYAKSSDQDFFKVYSTTDFLKNFEIVKKDFKKKANPTRITLRCKAIKKFLPYEGFYPCQRTVDLSKQFYDSYGFFVSGSSWNTHRDGSSVVGSVASVSPTSKYISQNLMTPLFSPGILFNSIKSGIACDFPTMVDSYMTRSFGDQYYIDDKFTKRIPFEALMEPEKHLANYEFYSMEADPQSPKIKSSWTGQGDELYKLMINNFVSEVGDFFLENERHTTITSLPEGDPNFGNTQPGKVYGMRIKMFRSITGSKGTETSHRGISYGLPQDIGSMGESFTMYSRPSGFGPPQFQTWEGIYIGGGSTSAYLPYNWALYKFDGSLDFSYKSDAVYTGATNKETGSNSDAGECYPFTPPYYHGEAWADIFFQPPSGSQKYSLSEIINNSSVEFYRHFLSASIVGPNPPVNGRSVLINDQSMQIASSMNIFSRGILREDSENVTINTQLETKYRWIIQSKWETPTLNFNHLSHEDLTRPPLHATASVPIGMWHQYGRLPQRTDEGVFIQVTDIPSNWIEGSMGGNLNNTGSLIDLCGFSTDPIRVGEIKNTKTVEEAVVAVPFVNRDGFREFFKLNKTDIKNAINGIEEAVGQTVFELTQQLDKYVFPPQFDYKRNKDIDAVVMYVFEFSHKFTKQDLADIWQNLPPNLGEVHETAEATVSHSLFAEEFLGIGADPKKTANGIERNIVSELTDLPSDIQWMVFKVKKRAKSNYFEKMFQRNESRDSDSNNSFTVDSTGKKTDVSYNWPYDFFSMVELIKLEAEVEFSNVDEEKSKEEKKLVTKPYVFRED